ncbi:NAD(P)-binding domain-containing protein [Aquiflexum lacus]|uniref:NAD(P)-binding domain-containing protein n=1 Tax=Aquiflexum lacus TaxID=2483805 RepID=UPI001893D3D7|nr:NAD(P)H-binding protein [Aquiflexum lacus]
MTSVSIIGLGWLGLPLAKALKEKGFQVKGSTTSPEKLDELNTKGISTYLLKLMPHPEGKGFQELFETEILFINIPPRSRTMPETFHPEQIKFIKSMAIQAGVKKIIYVSSTSVYPDLNGELDETFSLTKNNTGNISLFQAENILLHEPDFDLTIIRFGGLLGVDRIPGRYFSGKTNVVGDSPVNYIHRDDAVGISSWVIENNLWSQIYNGVAPYHPKRKLVYEKNALDLGFSPPKDYAPVGKTDWKQISSQKIQATGYKFQIPDPLDFWYS